MNYRKFVFAVVTAICILWFVMLQWNNFFNLTNHQELVVYKVNGHTALDIRDKSSVFFFSDASFTDQERIRFHIRPYRLQRGVHKIADGEQQKFVKEFKGCKVIQWRNTAILLIHEKNYLIPENLIPDYVVVSNNVMLILTEPLLKSRKLILDSSNSGYFANRIREKFKSTGLEIYAVNQQGAFLTKL